MTFKELNQKIQAQFIKMCETGKLFRSELTGQQVWDLYLEGFTPEQNPVFRDPNSSTHNCNNDKHFIRRYGNIVALSENFEIMTMFDIDVAGSDYENTIPNLSKWIKEGKISDVFIEVFDAIHLLNYERTNKNQTIYQLGVKETFKKYTQEEADKFGVVNTHDIYTFNHFHVFIPTEFIDKSGKSAEAIMGDYRDAKNVFQRAMQEIPLDTLRLVQDLIQQGSLLNGETHLNKVQSFINLKEAYDKTLQELRDNWCWKNSYKLPIAKFRNELIGTLCVELAEGVELNKACQTWNKRVDPANYMKAKAPITQNQIKQAQQFVEENGYEASFNRRFATLDDINVSEILHVNSGTGVIKTASLFDNVKPSVSTRYKRAQFDDVIVIGIEDFMKNVLPTATSLEVFLEGKMENNLVTLITSDNQDSNPLFKWNNNFSWTYNGNLTGKSEIKENVKAVGGNITGILRCSLQWNDEDTKGVVDFDLHCKTPFSEIFFSTKKDNKTGGWLDVDMINPTSIGIENITWQKPLLDGVYKFFVNNYSRHIRHNGFKAEIEFDGNVYTYQTKSKFTNNLQIATIVVKNGVMSITHHLPHNEEINAKSLWGLDSNEFHKVNLMCLSPNFWGENNVGNKHYFFMLEGCHSDVPMRSFHNEFLVGNLLEHRKVMEVLAETTKLTPTKKQLAGLGFNATVREELIVKVKGTHQRVMKIQF